MNRTPVRERGAIGPQSPGASSTGGSLKARRAEILGAEAWMLYFSARFSCRGSSISILPQGF